MKRLTICLAIGLVCLSLISVLAAPKDPSKEKALTPNLSDEACKAIEQYIASVEAAGSLKDAAARKVQYAAAEEELAEVLKRNGKAALLTEITEYARYSEVAATAGSRDPNLTRILSDQLKTRSKLLGWCTTDAGAR
ncbi:MAG: hypothetical protein V1792_05280 [Pseudomonadota bacterium]